MEKNVSITSPLEQAMVISGINRFRKRENQASERGKGYTTPAGIALTRQILVPLAGAIESFIERSYKGRPGARSLAVHYLQQLDPWVTAFLTCRAMVDKLSKTTLLTTQAYHLGNLIEDECRLGHFAEEMPEYYFRLYSDTLEWTTNTRRRKARLMQAMVDKGLDWQPWEQRDKIKLAIKLIELFSEISGLIQFRHLRHSKSSSRLVVQATPEALSFIRDKNAALEGLKPLYSPLVERPRDWTSFDQGGFHTLPLKLVKTSCKEHLEVLRQWPMPKVYQAVNALQQTPYRINTPVYEVTRILKDRGLEVAGLPKPYNPLIHDKTGWSQKDFEVYKEGQILLNRNLEVELTLKMAQEYLPYEEFYFVHTLDFRGRAYPVTSYLSPQGDDLNRGLLTFASCVSQPLGNNGACWLAIHGANCYGLNKTSHEERIAWVLANSERIHRVARDPLNDYWWADAEDPFQFLAFCFEWQGYLREGVSYKCSLPVAVDGSNNALQHFSALSLEKDIAKATNLSPDAKPQDIYQEVCDEVNSIITHDAKQGIAEALQWQGRVTRKDIKRPVMTHCYGAQEYGFRHMVFEDTLKPLRMSGKPWPFERDGWKAATYLAKVIKQALKTRLHAMEAYMQWFRMVASLLAEQDLPVRWVNPADFPVVQAYKQQSTRQIKTHLSGRIIRPTLATTDIHKLDKKAQSNGISANFIHSLDSAAMMLTLQQALANEIKAFRMIHDSYATVPGDVSLLNFCLRQAFVQIYSEDILGYFCDDVMTILEKEEKQELPERPKQGTFDIDQVMDSGYFFS